MTAMTIENTNPNIYSSITKYHNISEMSKINFYPHFIALHNDNTTKLPITTNNSIIIGPSLNQTLILDCNTATYDNVVLVMYFRDELYIYQKTIDIESGRPRVDITTKPAGYFIDAAIFIKEPNQ